MSKFRRNRIINAVVVSALIAAAYSFHVYAMLSAGDNFLGHALGGARSLIYIGLFTAWGISAGKRVAQVQARDYMMAIAALIVVWIVVRSVKYLSAVPPDPTRYLWYLYYFPIIFVPLFSVFVAMSLDKPEDYRLPGWTGLLTLVGASLLLLVMTNDTHQLVFVFRASGGGFDTKHYSYGPVYFIVCLWELGCAAVTFALIGVKCRGSAARRRIVLPLIPMALLIVYGVLYVLRALPPIYINDITVMMGLLIIAVFEAFFRTGLIQSNTHYMELFQMSGLRAVITDEEYNVRLSSDEAAEFPVEIARRAEVAPVPLGDGTRLSSAPIRGGHTLWTEDVSEVNRLLDELRIVGKNLEGENALLRAENELREKKSRVDARNRLYDRMTKEVERPLATLGALLREARSEPDRRDAALARIAALGAYLKRRGNMLLLGEESKEIPTAELFYSLRESADNMEAAGVSCHCVSEGQGMLDTGTALALYDFFEDVTEAAFDTLRSALIRLKADDSLVTARLFLSCNVSAEEITAMPRYQKLLTLGEGAVSAGEGEVCIRISVPAGGERHEA